MKTLVTYLDVSEFIQTEYGDQITILAKQTILKRKENKDVGVFRMIQKRVLLVIYPRIMRVKTTEKTLDTLQQEYEYDTK
ncbi:unnamed protein product, partial [Sphenostylis stenocarpa]